MKIVSLKNKLIAGSLAIVILVMLASAVVVSVVINRQNKSASFDNIEKSINIARDELSSMQTKLLSDTNQMAVNNEIGATLQFIMDFQDDVGMIEDPLMKLALGVGQIGRMGNLWKSAVYDLKGRLNIFAVAQGGGDILLGVISDRSKGTPKVSLMKGGQESDWRDSGPIQDEIIKAKFDKGIPDKEIVFFNDIGNSLCIEAYAPIYAEEISEDTGNAAKKPAGFVMCVRKLEKPFIDRVGKLTAMKINLFTDKGLYLGDIEEYKKLQADEIEKSTNGWSLDKGTISLNKIDLEVGEFFQGILPFYGENRFMGAVAALQSTDIVKENTWYMARLLGFCLPDLYHCADTLYLSILQVID